LYSTTFALIVIIGIAGMNLFLGFAAALLIGRGPKSWSDVDQAFIFRGFSPELIRVRGKSTAEASPPKADAGGPPTRRRAPHTEPAIPKVSEPPPGTDHPTSTVPTEPQAEEAVLKLEPLVPQKEIDDTPADEMLEAQLLEWRDDEEAEDIASISVLVLSEPNDDTEPEAVPLLRQAVYKTMRQQIRRDRVLMIMGAGQYVWFSADVHPEDALMPVERIRQTIQNTHYEYLERPLAIKMHSAVAAVRREDRAKDLTTRLLDTITVAQQSNEDVVFLELGSGPKATERIAIEVEESTCVL
jgi:hypothetical protein